MPGKRITDLTALSGANSANNDDLVIFDATASETKRISRSQLAEGMQADVQVLSNKTMTLGSNTITGTTAQFNTALTDNNFATQAGSEVLTNKTIDSANNTLTVNYKEARVETSDASRTHLFTTVAALLADTGTYTTYAAGQIVEAGGFRYQVAASGASDQHVTTAGGVKLYEVWRDRDQVGDTYVAGASRRDGYVVSRTLEGQSDVHGFGDRQILDNITDAGTFASFDTIAELRGDHEQDHFYGYQARQRYAGGTGGILDKMAGFWSRMRFSGLGTINNLQQIEINDVELTGDGDSSRITSHIGILIRNLANGVNKAGLVVLQSTGFAIRASAAGRNYFRGNTMIGNQDLNTGVPLAVSGVDVGPYVFLTSTATQGYVGVTGDNILQFLTNAAPRWEISVSGTGYALRPVANELYDLGGTTRRIRNGYIQSAYVSTVFPGGSLTVRWTSGAGSPEGVVTGAIGSLYTRTDGGAGTTLYIKESGSGNTGWVAK